MINFIDEFKYFFKQLIELRSLRSNVHTLTETAYDKKNLKISIFVKLGLTNFDWILRRIYYFFKYNFLIHDEKKKAIRKIYLNYCSPLNNNIISIHQYGLSKKYLKNCNYALCFGIGEDLFFEEYLARILNFKVLAGDPTPASIKFMQKKPKIKNLEFISEAIWTENGVKKFFVNDDYNSNKEYSGDGSLTNFRKTNTFIYITCHDLKYYMKKLNINEIDVLKMDIEGAAISIIDYCLNNNLYPKQITGEIEIPQIDFEDTISKLENLLSKLKSKYSFFLINQKNRFQKFEFLMVRNN